MTVITIAPEEWTSQLAPSVGWRTCYPFVAERARLILAKVHAAEALNTSDLVEAMWPVQLVNGVDQLKARSRLFQALKAMATRELSEFARKGEPYKRRQFNKGHWGTTVARPWLWANYGSPNEQAVPRPTCPHCGGVL